MFQWQALRRAELAACFFILGTKMKELTHYQKFVCLRKSFPWEECGEQQSHSLCHRLSLTIRFIFIFTFIKHYSLGKMEEKKEKKPYKTKEHLLSSLTCASTNIYQSSFPALCLGIPELPELHIQPTHECICLFNHSRFTEDRQGVWYCFRKFCCWRNKHKWITSINMSLLVITGERHS